MFSVLYIEQYNIIFKIPFNIQYSALFLHPPHTKKYCCFIWLTTKAKLYSI